MVDKQHLKRHTFFVNFSSRNLFFLFRTSVKTKCGSPTEAKSFGELGICHSACSCLMGDDTPHSATLREDIKPLVFSFLTEPHHHLHLSPFLCFQTPHMSWLLLSVSMLACNHADNHANHTTCEMATLQKAACTE